MQFKIPWRIEALIYTLIVIAGALMVAYGVSVAVPLMGG
jgi:hypothetical protein